MNKIILKSMIGISLITTLSSSSYIEQGKRIEELKNTPVKFCINGGRVDGVKLPPVCGESNMWDYYYNGRNAIGVQYKVRTQNGEIKDLFNE